MNSHDCILCRSSSSCCVSRCEDRRRSTSLRACVCSRLSLARLVNPKPKTIEQISSKPKPSQVCRLRKCPIKYHCQDCTKTHVVYEARCNLCPNNYIGSTTVALHYRARQHIYAIRRCDNTYALGEHFTKDHRDTAPSVMFRVVESCNQDELRLRIAEAYWIRPLPKMLFFSSKNAFGIAR